MRHAANELDSREDIEPLCVIDELLPVWTVPHQNDPNRIVQSLNRFQKHFDSLPAYEVAHKTDNRPGIKPQNLPCNDSVDWPKQTWIHAVLD